MKRKILILLVPITIFFYPSYTQTAYNAEDLVQLIDKKDWFNCELVYKANKDSYNSFTQLKAESYLYTYFNQPEKAIEKLNIIADTHAESLGIKVIPFLDLLAKNYSYIQRYDKAHEIYSYLSTALLNVLPPNQLNHLKECARRYAAFKDIPRHMIIMNKSQSPIPIDTLMGGLIYLPFKSDAYEAKIIFDTGANMNYATESVAKQLGIKPLLNDVKGNSDRMMGTIGILEKFHLGNILVINSLFYIVPDAQLTEGSRKFDLILGTETMKLMKCIEFDFAKMNMNLVPKPSMNSLGKNMILVENRIFIKAEINDQTYSLFYDSGAISVIQLNQQNKHLDQIFKNAPTKELRFLSAVDTIIQNYKYINNFNISMANTDFTYPIVYCSELKGWGNNSDGLIGKTITEEFAHLRIDFENMRIEVSN